MGKFNSHRGRNPTHHNKDFSSNMIPIGEGLPGKSGGYPRPWDKYSEGQGFQMGKFNSHRGRNLTYHNKNFSSNTIPIGEGFPDKSGGYHRPWDKYNEGQGFQIGEFMNDQERKPRYMKHTGTQKCPYPNRVMKNGVQITEYSSDSTAIMKMTVAKSFPGKKVVDPKLLEKYDKGQGVQVNSFGHKNSLHRHKLKQKEIKIKQAEEDAARAEILLTESSGQLEAEEGFSTADITQGDIKRAVDITSATKSFDLKLEFGPYKMHFTRNGRHLLLGGRKGHLAAMDWITKKLHYEINVMESIHDVCWLHTEHMMAVAQKKWVYIYDKQGIEIHCLKTMNDVLKLEFLPYHLLLCSAHENGFLSWLDVTLGKEVVQFPTRKGRLEIMCQNPYNAVLCCGHPNGTVSMWTPNTKEPVASVLCHSQSIKAINIDPTGRYMATAGVDRQLKIWDARNLGEPMQSFWIGSGASNLSFSQKKLLAVSKGRFVEVFKDVASGVASKPYMRHYSNWAITDMQFCPYEDVLGISTYKGYSSLIIPGAGEPNFDALESNLFMSASGRREAEVKALLSKVPMDLITLDPLSITQVDTPRLKEKLDAMDKLIHIRKPKIDFTPRYRMKGKSGSAQTFKRMRKATEEKQREYLKSALAQQEEFGLNSDKKGKVKTKPVEILDRFKPKQMKAPKPKI